MSYFTDVRDFHVAGDIVVPATPAIPDDKVVEHRKKLLYEEFYELIDAMDGRIPAKDADVSWVGCIAKEIADVVYVALGAALDYGIPFDEVWDAVQASNMAKIVDGKIYRRDDGKIIKPHDWQKPDIDGVLDAAA